MKRSKKNINKKIKIIKIIVLILSIILVGELIYMGALSYKQNKNNTYYTFINGLVSTDKGFVGVGNSDFKYGKSHKKQSYSKALLNVYNKDFKVKKEIMLDLGNNSYYNDIVSVDDGFIAVGAIEMNDNHTENGASEGLIIKYDKNYKQVFRKNFKILGNTEFTKVKALSDGSFVVVGKSIYEKDVIGNHTTGGAIVVKFDKDGKEISRANYKGPFKGIFTDILVDTDGYAVVGSINDSTAVLIKYDENLKEKWHYHYSYTDTLGFTSINKIDDNYILTGTKLDNKDKLDYYKASLVIVNNNGKKVKEITYKASNFTVFNDLLIDKDNNITVVGVTGIKGENTVTDGIIVTYNKDYEVTKEEKLSYSNNESYNKIYNLNNKKYILGYTNSKIKGIKSNGKDYFPIIKELN
jgi:hypothetical protein